MNKYITRAGIFAMSFLLLGAKADWSSTFEAVPGNSDNFAEGPLRIRDTKENVRRRLQAEHYFGSGTTVDNGLHALGSSRAYVSNTAPTAIINSDFDITGSGNATLTGDESGWGSSPIQKTGQGRTWVDPDGPDNVFGNADDFTVKFFIQDPNNDADYSDAGWYSVRGYGSQMGANVLLCGSFECMTTSDTTVPVLGPWAVTAGTLAYAATDATEGASGLYIRNSTTTDGDSIQYELDGLKTSATYAVTGRVKKVSGTGSCALKTLNMTTGSGVDMVEASTTSATFETIRGVFLTGTSLASSPLLDLEVNVTSGTVVCAWDHVSVREVFLTDEELDTPGNFIKKVTYTDSENITDSAGGTPFADADNPVMTATVTVPGDGYYVKVMAKVCIGMDGVDEVIMLARLKEGSTEIDRSVIGNEATSNEANVATLVMQDVRVDVAPGTYTYTVEVDIESDGGSYTEAYTNIDPATYGSGNFGNPICNSGTPSWLTVEVVRAN